MEEKAVLDSAGFAAVWRRVRAALPEASGATVPASPAPAQADAEPAAPTGADTDMDTLRGFVACAARAAAFYEALAARSCGASAALRRLAGAEREQLRRLQLELFLHSGDTLAPARSCPVRGGVLEGLRAAWLAERENAARYQAAAQRAPTQELTALYGALAASETAHAATLHGLIAAALR